MLIKFKGTYINIKINMMFKTSYAFIAKYNDNNKKYNKYVKLNIISINDYLNDKKIQSEINSKKKYLICCENHKLIPVTSDKKNKNGKSRRNFFKHKGGNKFNHPPMSMWHYEWQKNFTNIEIHFEKKKNSVKRRIADVVLNDKIIIEFQHSKIEKKEISQRKQDYSLHNKNIIWVVDGNNIEIKKMRNKNFYLDFKSDTWKHSSFLDYEHIYLDFKLEDGNMIFKLNPKAVKMNMVDIEKSAIKEKTEFIKLLKNDKLNEWIVKESIFCNMYFKQMGAGSGKTYNSIQLLNTERFSGKNNFIYLTKMHSAKDVIYNELCEQYEKRMITNIDKMECDDNKSKQYQITFFDNIQKKEKRITIGTIDSFMFALGKINRNTKDFFGGIVDSIIGGFIDIDKQGNLNKTLKFGKLNIETLIIIDEAQDLRINYIKSICKIMRETYVDTYIIGDKMQSIWGEHNVFVKTHELPHTNIIKITPKNIVRRFHNKKFIDIVNILVPFEKYKLPKITDICNMKKCKYNHNVIDPYVPFEMYNDPMKNEQYKVTEKIIKYINEEIEENYYLPNDFMFIFPFISKNINANYLLTKLQKFWIKKFEDINYQKNVLDKNPYWSEDILVNDKYIKKYFTNIYHRFVVKHNSEEGKPINLQESKYATQFLSIHAAKGNGRPVVFLLQLSEYTLKKFSYEKNNLVYDSLLHVAVTRQKQKLYVGLTERNDDIWNRFEKIKGIKIEQLKNKLPNIKMLSKYFTFEKILNFLKINDIIHTDIINDTDLKPQIDDCYEIINNETKKKKKNIVDWGHHIIRFYILIYNFQKNLINNLDTNFKKIQFVLIIHDLRNLEIRLLERLDYYSSIYNKNKDKKKNQLSYIPLLKFKSNIYKVYEKYYYILQKFIENIQKKILLNEKKNKLPNLCPLETIILFHCIYIVRKKNYHITIMDVYDIIYSFDLCYDNILNNHHVEFDCLCSEHFRKKRKEKIVNDEKNPIEHSIRNHYDELKYVKKIFNNLKKKIKSKYKLSISDFEFNFDYRIYIGKNNAFSAMYDFHIVGNSEKYIINFIIQPALNKLNFYDTILKALYIHCSLKNIKNVKERDNQNFSKFYGKKIITCILTLDNMEPFVYKFNINDKTILKFSEYTKKFLKKNYLEKKNIFEELRIYAKLKKKENNEKNTCKDVIHNMCDYIRNNKTKYLIPDFILSIFDKNKYQDDKKKDAEKLYNQIKNNEFYQYDNLLEINSNQYLGLNNPKKKEINEDDYVSD